MFSKVKDVLKKLEEWAPRIVVLITKGKGDVRNCSCHRTVKFF